MAQHRYTITFEVRWAWWLRPWLSALVFFAVACGREPDRAKVERMVARAARLKVRPAGAPPR